MNIMVKGCALVSLLALPGFSQQHPKFTATSQLVMLDVDVTEKSTGRVLDLLDLLDRKDFEIFDNGVRQEIKIADYGTAPLDVVFLIYRKSGAAPVKQNNALLLGLHAAVDAMEKDDRAAVLRTGKPSQADVLLTGNMDQVHHAIAWGGGNYNWADLMAAHDHLYDAVTAAAELFPLERNPARRQAIFAVTDDVERKSKLGLDALITGLVETGTTLYEVIVPTGVTGGTSGLTGFGMPPTRINFGASARTGKSLRDAVEATGGVMIPGDQIQDGLPALMKRARTRYAFGFYAEPTQQAAFHTIEVRLTPAAQSRYPNAQIRTRRGYYSVPAPPLTGSSPH